jgi:hypothetical protein
MAYKFKLETRDGAPADPPKFETAVLNWRPGDTIPLGGRSLRVLDLRAGDEEVVLVVEEV